MRSGPPHVGSHVGLVSGFSRRPRNGPAGHEEIPWPPLSAMRSSFWTVALIVSTAALASVEVLPVSASFFTSARSVRMNAIREVPVASAGLR